MHPDGARPKTFVLVAIALALAAATLLVYGQVRTHDFVNFDDDRYVYDNPNIREGFSRAGLVWAFTTFGYFYWQPLTWLTHMLDCQLFGLQAGWHHLTNLLLHLGSSLLVFLVFRRMTGALWRSAVLAALFALHPLRVESVAWIAERKDVLSGFWLMVTLWAYVRYARRPSGGRYGLVLLAMLMGLMSKPMLVTVPFLLLAIDYWPLERLDGQAIREKFPMLILAGISAVITMAGQSMMGATQWGAGLPLSLRLENAAVSYARYLGKTVWPWDLAIFYPYPPSIPAWQALGAALLLAVLTAATLWVGRRRRYLAAGWMWFAVGLIPTIGLVQVGRQAMADRFTYIPLLGLLAAMVWGGAELFGDKRLAIGVATVVLAGLGVRAWAQTGTWRNSVTVWQHCVDVTAPAATSQYKLAVALEDRGRWDAALLHYAEAVRIQPTYYLAQYGYGVALLARGEQAAAEAHFRMAIRYRQDYADAYYRLGEVLLGMGQDAEAAADMREALRLGLDPQRAARANAALAGDRNE